MAKAALSLFLLLLLAAPFVLPVEEFCPDGDDCCDLPCTDCYFHCSCSIGFIALPAELINFSHLNHADNASLELAHSQTDPGFIALPDLPPRLA